VPKQFLKKNIIEHPGVTKYFLKRKSKLIWMIVSVFSSPNISKSEQFSSSLVVRMVRIWPNSRIGTDVTIMGARHLAKDWGWYSFDKIWIYVPNLLFQRRHRRQFLIDYVPEGQKTIRGKYFENLLIQYYIHPIFKMY
jgi:hypothetical protein